MPVTTPPTLTHIAFQVKDVEACLVFYRDICGMRVVHHRPNLANAGGEVVWLASPGMEQQLIIVMFGGGSGHHQDDTDYGHLGFAVESKAAVDAIAKRARAAGNLAWEPRQDNYPVGYYCGVRDPDDKVVEFSYGQPLGPGAN